MRQSSSDLGAVGRGGALRFFIIGATLLLLVIASMLVIGPPEWWLRGGPFQEPPSQVGPLEHP